MQIVLMIAAVIVSVFGELYVIHAGSAVEKSDKSQAGTAFVLGVLLHVAALCLAFVSGGL